MFTWDENKCDIDIYQNGRVVIRCCTSRKLCKEMVITLSNLIGCKLDHYKAGGRDIIKCRKKDYNKVHEFLSTMEKDYFHQWELNLNGYVLY